MRQLLIPVLALGFFFGLKLPIPALEDARGILEKPSKHKAWPRGTNSKGPGSNTK
jgi:hypothetical protein